MKIIKLKGLKLKITDLNYNFIKEEMERCKPKDKIENFNSYSKLLKNLEKDSPPEAIENEVNKIIDFDNKKIKELKNEIKILKKERLLLSNFSNREANSSTTILNTIINTICIIFGTITLIIFFNNDVDFRNPVLWIMLYIVFSSLISLLTINKK